VARFARSGSWGVAPRLFPTSYSPECVEGEM
jgi:hypothetical protein